MANIKKIQKTIYLLNEACNRNKLTFPEDISGESEEEVNKNFFSHMVENDIKFKSSNDCLHPNLLSYWVKLKVCKIERKDTRSKSEIYLVNDKNQKINISKQIYFGYQSVEKVKNSKDKKQFSKLSEVQNYIYIYNESCNKEKLKIPSEVPEKSESQILQALFSKWVSEEIKFISSKDTLHPNLIRYLIKNNVCQIKRDEKGRTKGYCYLEDDSGGKVNISKQVYFGYQFVEKLREFETETHIKHFFDKNGYITNLKLEEWVRSWNGAKNTRRLDFVFDVGNGKKIVIEYLEKHHLKEYRDWSNYQTIRLVDILFGPYKEDIVHFAFIWDHLMNDDYLNEKVDLFCGKCKDHFDIENEEEYIIGILNENIDNPMLSKLIFEAYKNKNKPVLTLDNIHELFNIKEENYDYLKSKFIKRVKLKQKLDGGKESNNDDNDLMPNLCIVKEKKLYYEKNNDEILLSNHGFCLYLDLLEPKNFKYKIDYFVKTEFFDTVGNSAYNSAKKIRDLVVNQKTNLISGLEDIDD